jgi:hypothetical protein
MQEREIQNSKTERSFKAKQRMEEGQRENKKRKE